MMLMTGLLLTSLPVLGQAYQFEAAGAYSRWSDDTFGVSVDTDTVIVGASYYLRPVDASTGPLAERAFVDKAADVTLGFGRASSSSRGFDRDVEVDTLVASARFVTAEDFIVDLGFSSSETDVLDDDLNTYRLGAGKYLDGQTTVIATFERSERGDFEINELGVAGRKLQVGANAGTYVATEGELRYLDTDNDSGVNLLLLATYYPSTPMGLTAGFDFRKIGSSDGITLLVEAEYFLTPQLAIGAGFSREDFDVSERDIVTVSVTGRL